MRRTRILATVGPTSDDPEVIAALIRAGADAFRLNFSHGTVESHKEAVARIRRAATEAGVCIGILQDLPGPKIRTGPVAAPIQLSEGDALVIEHGDFVGEPGRISCPADALFASVRTGQRLLIDDGRIELEITVVEPRRLTTRVLNGGPLESRKGINAPGVTLRTPALTEKDIAHLRAGIAMGVDIVAVSFVQTPEDMRRARAAAAAAGAPDLPLIAKIEKPQAVECIDEILDVADGLMVARGDLGIELPLETLPAVQKRIVLAARRRGVPVILATEVLESMRAEPRPTRAEVTDAAHAVDERVDAIMLAGETASGKFPVRAVETLDRIIREAERAVQPYLRPSDDVGTEHGRALCQAAVTLAEQARAAAIVAITEAGKTARLLAALRPAARILAATPHVETAARLSLVWGVTPVVTPESALPAVREVLLRRGLAPSGAVIVIVAMHPVLGHDDGNFVRVDRL